MPTIKNSEIGILVTTSCPYGYDTTTVRIMGGKSKWISDEIEGTIDNKAGYGSPESCERVAARMKGYQTEGYVQIWDTSWSELFITVEYMHFIDSAGFGMPKISLGDSTRNIDAAIPIFKRLRKGLGWNPFPKSPDELIAKFKGAWQIISRDYDFLIDEPIAIREARKVNFAFQESQKNV